MVGLYRLAFPSSSSTSAAPANNMGAFKSDVVFEEIKERIAEVTSVNFIIVMNHLPLDRAVRTVEMAWQAMEKKKLEQLWNGMAIYVKFLVINQRTLSKVIF